MRFVRMLQRSIVAVAAAVALTTLSAGSASAQLMWDWGGGSLVGGSGRENVSISTQFKKGEIIVSFSDRKLYFITGPGQAISYPIAIPREQSRWAGVTSVTQKRINPAWTPTPTMIAENPRLPRWVPGGHPMNPLGNRALYLGSSTYRIHGTDAPWTIGSAVSKGCIRMYNDDVADLYPRANVGAKVTVTWNRFNTASAGDTPASEPVATKSKRRARNASVE
jgi:lipoprotein-anchoring transpeptidase ErfK/SrfK